MTQNASLNFTATKIALQSGFPSSRVKLVQDGSGIHFSDSSGELFMVSTDNDGFLNFDLNTESVEQAHRFWIICEITIGRAVLVSGPESEAVRNDLFYWFLARENPSSFAAVLAKRISSKKVVIPGFFNARAKARIERPAEYYTPIQLAEVYADAAIDTVTAFGLRFSRDRIQSLLGDID